MRYIIEIGYIRITALFQRQNCIVYWPYDNESSSQYRNITRNQLELLGRLETRVD